MLKLLSAIQFELDHLPVIGEIVKPARGRFHPYCWKTPKLGSSGVLHGVGLHHYTTTTLYLGEQQVEELVAHAIQSVSLGFSPHSLQGTVQRLLGLGPSDAEMLLPGNESLIEALGPVYRPAAISRLLQYIADTDILDAQHGQDTCLVTTRRGLFGFRKGWWIVAGQRKFREPIYPPVARVHLADCLDNTCYRSERIVTNALRWIVQENLLHSDLELALQIANLHKPNSVRSMLKHYRERI